MGFFEKLKSALKEVISYERGELALDAETFEYTFPDCPSCGNWIGGDCCHKNLCFTMLDSDGYRVGTPTEHKERVVHE